ncbi:MAG: dihydroorotase [Haemophilus parainfluenzae]|nr:MAG: dihydroorotase [Haemophilus parainfluenzae]
MKKDLILTQPDDWHLHLRDGPLMHRVLPFSSALMGRAVIMPNLVPPITTVAAAFAYRDRIVTALSPIQAFMPLMTLYLHESMPLSEIKTAKEAGIIAVKLYPKGATTHSASGVEDIERIYPLLAMMEKVDLPLLVHGEVVGEHYDIFDREAIFIDKILIPLRASFPELRIVLEHVSSEVGAQYVMDGDKYLAATLTPHHLLMNRNDLLVGGIRPHLYCLPIAKKEQDRRALVNAATGEKSNRFFLGTDSAPHPLARKECTCGCAGIFNAPVAIETVAEVFAQAGALNKLEAFIALNGPRFYRLPINKRKIHLIEEKWQVPDRYGEGDNALSPFWAGRTLNWRGVLLRE